jgi:23S rRNA (pseudouridine1915-N3)-methyltransferase
VTVYLYFVGKPRDRSANAMAAEYVKRIGRYARCEMRETKPERAQWWSKHPSARKVLLDPAGKSWDTAHFVHMVRRAEHDGQDLVFVVGGADGLPPEWRERADLLLSLSPLTLPHELARVILTEQLYRAFTTLRGHLYPR